MRLTGTRPLLMTSQMKSIPKAKPGVAVAAMWDSGPFRWLANASFTKPEYYLSDAAIGFFHFYHHIITCEKTVFKLVGELIERTSLSVSSL